MRNQELYKLLASTVGARLNCIKSDNTEWQDKHEETIHYLVKNFMPSGSGIDSGTSIDLDKSTAEKLVFNFGYHHMNENGYYDGWTDHTLTVVSSLQFDINLKISGRNRNDIKEYLYETFSAALVDEIAWDESQERYYSVSLRQAQENFRKSQQL